MLNNVTSGDVDAELTTLVTKYDGHSKKKHVKVKFCENNL